MSIEISSFWDLRKLRNSSEGDEFVLTDDIDFGFGFLPGFLERLILTYVFPIEEFNGVLDGQGYEIRDFEFISNTEIDDMSQFGGLIKKNNGVVKNLSLVGLDIYGVSKAAGLAIFNEGLVKSCSVSGSLEVGFMCSGVVGQNHGKVFDCSFNGVIRGSDYAGGVVGSNCCVVKSCESSGFFVETVTSGGIAFVNDSNSGECLVSDCFSDVSIKECSSAKSLTGGLVGENLSSGVVKDSYFVGNVYGNKFDNGFLVGRNGGVCENCYYIGEESKAIGTNFGDIKSVDVKDSVDSIENSIVAGKI